MNSKPIQNRFRFSLKLMLLFVMLVAVSIPIAQWGHRMLNSRPIELAIQEFESLQYEHYEKLTPLTPDEVIEFLESDDAEIQNSPEKAKAVFRQIVNTRRIPNTVKFDMATYRSGRKPGIDSMLIRLVITDEDFVYYSNIRTMEATPEMQPGAMWQLTSFPR